MTGRFAAAVAAGYLFVLPFLAIRAGEDKRPCPFTVVEKYPDFMSGYVPNDMPPRDISAIGRILPHMPNSRQSFRQYTREEMERFLWLFFHWDGGYLLLKQNSGREEFRVRLPWLEYQKAPSRGCYDPGTWGFAAL